MACTITPYNLLTGSQKQTGGNWRLIDGGPTNISINGAPFDLVQNDALISNQYDVTLGFDQTAPATLVFRYTVGVEPCIDTANLTVEVVAGASAGIAPIINKTFCNINTNPINLFDLLRGGTGIGNTGSGNVDTTGVWSGPGLLSSAYNAGSPTTPTDDTFTPSLVTSFPGGLPQVFSFTYTVSKSTLSTCTNCFDSTVLNITVTLQPNAGENASVTVCNLAP
jgi:hypothetical protein